MNSFEYCFFLFICLISLSILYHDLWKWRKIIAVNFPGFQLLKLENSLRWSFFTFIYNRSSKWIISYISHHHDLSYAFIYLFYSFIYYFPPFAIRRPFPQFYRPPAFDPEKLLSIEPPSYASTAYVVASYGRCFFSTVRFVTIWKTCENFLGKKFPVALHKSILYWRFIS